MGTLVSPILATTILPTPGVHSSYRRAGAGVVGAVAGAVAAVDAFATVVVWLGQSLHLCLLGGAGRLCTVRL